MSAYTIGMWLYQNGGGSNIQRQLVQRLKERGIETKTNLNLRDARAINGKIICHDTAMEELDLFFSYNAGQQTPYQVYLYQTLDQSIPIINNFDAFALTEDKFRTVHCLQQHGIATADYRLFHKDDIGGLDAALRQWGGKAVYKPTDGWGGKGIVKIEGEQALDMLRPFIEEASFDHFYIERFINYDNSDYRVDIVDGKLVGCYGRRAPKNEWKTNITSGGSVFPRELNDEIASVALQAAEATGLEIAGVDLIYDRDRQEYIVLEVNGIPAFATPEQEQLGIDFNSRKIDAIVELIDNTVRASNAKAA